MASTESSNTRRQAQTGEYKQPIGIYRAIWLKQDRQTGRRSFIFPCVCDVCMCVCVSSMHQHKQWFAWISIRKYRIAHMHHAPHSHTNAPRITYWFAHRQPDRSTEMWFEEHRLQKPSCGLTHAISCKTAYYNLDCVATMMSGFVCDVHALYSISVLVL